MGPQAGAVEGGLAAHSSAQRGSIPIECDVGADTVRGSTAVLAGRETLDLRPPGAVSSCATIASFMPSERTQRRIDRLLDQTETAADREDWELTARRAREALTLDAGSEDATALLASAQQMVDGDSRLSTDVERPLRRPRLLPPNPTPSASPTTGTRCGAT